ncbi:acyltransferase [Gracilibacillus sp. D59]|uniref:acyltransferase n=1 Tax=Gracilibacillus sp. D59 TaxID=3457434 RepID=UPI003FCE18B0
MKKIILFIGKLCWILSKSYKKLISLYLKSYYMKEIGNIGGNVHFNGSSVLTGLNNISIGTNVHIGNNAFIRGEGGLEIGDNTHISRNLVLYTQNHNYEGSLLPYDDTLIYKPVIIEKNVWIGMNVIILPGTHIMEGAIIGAGSVVVGEVKKCTIYGSSIAKPIKVRDIEKYTTLEMEKKYSGINGKPL